MKSHPATLHIGDVEQRVDVSAGGGGVLIEGIPELNPPGTAEQLRNLMDHLAKSGEWERQKIRLTSRERYHPWAVQVALLKAGFLAAFAKLGYRFALHPALEVVREQIQHPDDQLLSPFGGWFEDGFDGWEMWHFQEPARAIFVQIDRDFVFLPDPSAPESSYERALGMREEMMEGGKGRRLDWPTTMHMALDKQG